MVQVEGLDKLLSEHPFFEGMDPAAREIIAGCAKNEKFQAGEVIVSEGAKADKFYLIRHGYVSIELHVPARESIVLETIGAGDIFGWSGLVPPYRWSFDVRAVELVRAVSLDAKCLRKKMQKDHSLGYELYQRFIPVMAERLGAARMQLLDMYANPKN